MERSNRNTSNAWNESPSTIELVRAAQQGCRDSFDRLSRRYEKLLHAIAFRRLGNYHDAEDETQNVLTEAFLHLRSLKDAANFEAWLARLAKNRCVDRLRRKLNVESRVDFQEDVTERLECAPALPVDTEAVAGAVNALSRPLRETLELYYFQNCSLKEISARLAVPLNTVKRRLHDARQKLREAPAGKVLTGKSADAPNLLPASFDRMDEDVEQQKITEPA